MARNYKRENRTRRTKHSIQTYGRNARQVWNEYPAVKIRLVYLCNLLFNGNYHEFAAAAGLCYRDFYRVLYGHSRLSVNMAAQIVSRVGVRAEWLLCGSGDILPPTCEEFVLPAQLQSTFDSVQFNPGTEFFPKDRLTFADVEIEDTAPYNAAGRAIHLARVNRKSVGFFLGSEFFALPAPQLLFPFYDSKYANLLVMTLSAAAHDIYAAHPNPPTDLNAVALFAANRGVGYGEALGLVGLPSISDRSKSLLTSVHDIHVPVLISAELGEIGRHTAPSVRGAEVGAAIGAAAYVDLLIYTEQLRNFFGAPGGVMVVAGDAHRAVRLFLERLPTLQLAEPDQTGFTFVLFSEYDTALESEIKLHGGHGIFLGSATFSTVSQLLQTCHDVYAGKITHER
jgi:hypothetical protein